KRSRRWSTPLSGRSRSATSSDVCSGSRPTAPTAPTPQPAGTAPGRASTTTHSREYAADSLQIARSEIIDSIRDCGHPRSRRRGEAGDPVAGDVLAATYPHPGMSEDVLDEADQRFGAAGMAGQAH